MPLQTMARDFCLKVHGNESYRGLTAEQVAAGWLFYYDSWKHEPFIKSGKTVASFLEVSSDATPQDEEHLAMVAMLARGNAFKVFPFTEDNGNTLWLSPADRIPSSADETDYIFMTTVFDRIAREISLRQWKNADDEINRLLSFQQAKAPAGTLPSRAELKAELIYNRFGALWPVAILAAATSMLTMFHARRRHAWVWSTLSSLTIALWLTAIILLRSIIGKHLPFSNGYETMLLLGWMASWMALFSPHRLRMLRTTSLLAAAMALLVSHIGRSGATVGHLMPVLASPLLSIHVLLVMASYLLFTVITFLAVWELCAGSDRPNSAKASSSLAGLSLVLLYPAVFLLGAGIITGAVWANQSWGRYWGWDPKETWALVTLLIYAVPLHGSSISRLRNGKPLAIYLIAAFLSVIMTYFGVNYLLPGLHSYA